MNSSRGKTLISEIASHSGALTFAPSKSFTVHIACVCPVIFYWRNNYRTIEGFKNNGSYKREYCTIPRISLRASHCSQVSCIPRGWLRSMRCDLDFTSDYRPEALYPFDCTRVHLKTPLLFFRGSRPSGPTRQPYSPNLLLLSDFIGQH